MDDAYVPEIETEMDYYNYKYSSGGGGHVFVPLKSWPVIYRYDEPEMVALKASSTEAMTQAGNKTAEILNTAAGIKENSDANIKYKSPALVTCTFTVSDILSSVTEYTVSSASPLDTPLTVRPSQVKTPSSLL